MKFARAYSHIIGTFLIIICLALAASNLAYAAAGEGDSTQIQSDCSMAVAAPCGGCPCTDGQGSDCCGSSFCSCECHAPLSRDHRIVYAPVIVTQGFREPTGSLPQVYLSIFVPPQNPA